MLVSKLFRLLQSLDQKREQLRQLHRHMEDLLRRWEEEASAAPPLRQRMHQLVTAIGAQLPDLERLRDSGSETWSALKQRLQPSYEAVVTTLGRYRYRVPSLRPRNLRRSLFHFLSGLTCLLLIQHLLPRWLWAVLPCGFAALAWSLEAGRRRWPGLNTWLLARLGPIAHHHEAEGINSSTWYVSALALLGLSASLLAASLAVIVLAVSDPLASEVGRRIGRIRLGARRTLEGGLAFLVSGWLAGLVVCAVYFPGLDLGSRLLLCLAGALSGAVAELLSTRVDDNFLVPLAVAAGVSLAGLGLPV